MGLVKSVLSGKQAQPLAEKRAVLAANRDRSVGVSGDLPALLKP
ncbi:hypothetical protein Rleg9DRAFT_2133 [Rhizobium leguminosarum bv. trifolii WSM597]|uniref:Uncharacterized protein n=1 Tax=Rhizobium leguminosarum bv. trifolii WSM597 TaxID=754764 RepID=I9X3G0_RHILT|nr:hypothetical protein Rleg9DRAFT_2133 [Rhizobium leguminosarum bv. trifolii WSM597]